MIVYDTGCLPGGLALKKIWQKDAVSMLIHSCNLGWCYGHELPQSCSLQLSVSTYIPGELLFRDVYVPYSDIAVKLCRGELD